MKKFVIFKMRTGEKENAYSLVNDKTFGLIPAAIILISFEVEDKLYTKEELATLRDTAINEHNKLNS